MRRLTTCLMPLCAVIHAAAATVDAAECPHSITSECSISGDTPARGPRYLIPTGADGVVNIKSNVTAKYRDEVIRVTGKSPDMTVNIEDGKTLTADYTVIALERDASLKKITLEGVLSSNFEHAFRASAKAAYDLEVTGEAKSASEFMPALLIDGAAKGKITVGGKVTGGQGGGILYSTEANDLKSGAVGEHTLIISNDAQVSATGTQLSGAAITVGASANVNIAPDLPVYKFSKMTVLGTVKGKSAAIALNHGVLQGNNWTIGETGRVEGEKAAIRLGKVANNIGHGRFDGTITNIGTVTASAGPAIVAEGDISASIINSGTIVSKGASPVALDFSKATKTLSYTQTKGKTEGAIVGHQQHKANVTFDGGTFAGDVHNARFFKLDAQMELRLIDGFIDQSHVNVQIPAIAAGVAKDLAFSLVKGKYKGKLSSAKTLSVASETELQLTHPIKLSTAQIDGAIGLDLNTLDKAPAYVDAGKSVSFGKQAAVKLRIRDARVGHPYPLFKAPAIQGQPDSVKLYEEQDLYTVEGRKAAGNLYVASFVPKDISEQLRRAGANSGQIRVYNHPYRDVPDAARELLGKVIGKPGELAKLVQELTPPTQTTTATLQTTALSVSDRIQNRLVNTRFTPSRERAGMVTPDLEHGFWVQAHKDSSEQDKQKNQRGYKGEQAGLTVGFDTELEQLVDTLGLAYTAVNANTEYKKSRNKLSTDLNMLTLYGSTQTAHGELNSQFSFGLADNSAARYVNNVKHKADYGSTLLNAQLLLQNSALLAAYAPVMLVTGLKFTHVSNEKHRFKGEFLNDRIKSSDATAFELGLGLRCAGEAIADNIVPRASVMGWFDLINDKLDTRYSVGTNPGITIRAPEKGRFTLTGQFGLDYLNENLILSADITGIWRSGFSDLGLLGRIRYEF